MLPLVLVGLLPKCALCLVAYGAALVGVANVGRELCGSPRSTEAINGTMAIAVAVVLGAVLIRRRQRAHPPKRSTAAETSADNVR